MIDKNPLTNNLKKIRSEVLDLKKNLMNLKFQKSTGQLEKTAEIKNTRLKIARLKTQINKISGEKNA
jgi:ribosomal protein L29